MGTSGVLSQLFGGGASSGSGEKGWYHDTTANNPDGKGKRISLAKRLDLVRLAALSVTLVLAIQPAVSCGARQQQRRGFATAVVNEACHVGGFDVCTCAGTM